MFEVAEHHTIIDQLLTSAELKRAATHSCTGISLIFICTNSILTVRCIKKCIAAIRSMYNWVFPKK